MVLEKQCGGGSLEIGRCATSPLPSAQQISQKGDAKLRASKDTDRAHSDMRLADGHLYPSLPQRLTT